MKRKERTRRRILAPSALDLDPIVRDLARLRINLDVAKVGGFTEARRLALAALEPVFKQKVKELVAATTLTESELLERVRREIVREQARQRRDELKRRQFHDQQANAVSRHQEFLLAAERLPQFHVVQPGSFLMGACGGAVAATISLPMTVMAAPVSQFFYREIAELAARTFGTKYSALNSDPSTYKGDARPVEMVSWVDAQMWTQALNDLSRVNTRKLKPLMPGHKAHTAYRAFMTETEREYLMKRATTETGETIEELVKTGRLEEFGVFGRSDLVGTASNHERRPLIVDGREFYGLIGNVQEWMADAWDGISLPAGGIDPVGVDGRYRIFRGSSWKQAPAFASPEYRDGGCDSLRSPCLGFRLLRL